MNEPFGGDVGRVWIIEPFIGKFNAVFVVTNIEEGCYEVLDCVLIWIFKIVGSSCTNVCHAIVACHATALRLIYVESCNVFLVEKCLHGFWNSRVLEYGSVIFRCWGVSGQFPNIYLLFENFLCVCIWGFCVLIILPTLWNQNLNMCKFGFWERRDSPAQNLSTALKIFKRRLGYFKKTFIHLNMSYVAMHLTQIRFNTTSSEIYRCATQ